jgi:hypothetical protein
MAGIIRENSSLPGKIVTARGVARGRRESRMRCLTLSHARCSYSDGVSRMLVRSLSSLGRRRPKAGSLSHSSVQFLQRRSLTKLVRSLSLTTVGEDRARHLTRSHAYGSLSGGVCRNSCALSLTCYGRRRPSTAFHSHL